MTEPKHTPGPWFHEGTHVFVDSRYQVCCGRWYNECCGNPDIAGDYGPIADTSERDAPLISAAPDLYAALDQLLDDMGDEGLSVCQAAKDQAKAALAKARGDSI